MKLIFMNVAVFLVISIALVFARLGGFEAPVAQFLSDAFAMPTGLWDYLYHPWTIITSMFAHFGFMHIFLNMLMLYFIGRMFEQIYDGKKLLYTYLLGGLAGGALEIVAHLLFPGMYGQYTSVVGASGAVMALFILIGSWGLLPSVKVDKETSDFKSTLNSFKNVLTKLNYMRAYSLIFFLNMSAFVIIPFLSPYAVKNIGILQSELKYLYLFGGVVTIITSRIFQHIIRLKLTANNPWDILISLATSLNR